jgi:N-acetyl-gamma-glutamyl-phosphate reductase
MENKIKVGVVGGAGYTGGETIRLLLNHPQVELTFVHSRSNAGNGLEVVHPDLLGETKLKFTDSLKQDVDVIFLCLGHGESKRFLQENTINDSVKIIDLSQDFRLGDSINGREFVYGLPEVNKELLKKS